MDCVLPVWYTERKSKVKYTCPKLIALSTFKEVKLQVFIKVKYICDLCLRFMGPCIVSIFQYVFNKMQRYTVYLYLETALHVSVGTFTLLPATATCRYSDR
jgi:hypothetical protein